MSNNYMNIYNDFLTNFQFTADDKWLSMTKIASTSNISNLCSKQ